MGQAVCDAVEGADDMSLVGRADPQLGVALEDVLGDADVVVDFTQPDTALHNARLCLEAGVHCVMGTTGADFAELDGVGSANLFVAPNFAIGAVLMMEAAKLAAPHMPECEIVELHHDQKLDAPSGTAARPAAMSTSRSTRCVSRGSWRTRRSSSAASARRSPSATTRSPANRSCPACCWRSARSGSCRSPRSSGSRSCCSGSAAPRRTLGRQLRHHL